MIRLFAGGFPRDLEEAELQEIFEQFGEVLAVKIVRDKNTAISRRFGFVDMATQEGADAAIGQLHGGSIDDDEISVTLADDREQEKQKAKAQAKARPVKIKTGGYSKPGYNKGGFSKPGGGYNKSGGGYSKPGYNKTGGSGYSKPAGSYNKYGNGNSEGSSYGSGYQKSSTSGGPVREKRPRTKRF